MNSLHINRLIRLGVITAVTGAGLGGCASTGGEGTLASLQDVEIEIREEKIEGSLDKALQSYQKFLEETPETAMTPEAIRRLADLKIEKEYSATAAALNESPVLDAEEVARKKTPKPEMAAPPVAKPDLTSPDVAILATGGKEMSSESGAIADLSESEKDFSERATRKQSFKADNRPLKSPVKTAAGKAEDLQTAGAMEAIELYKGLLEKYPLYERNDQVMYQLSRAYEETGQVEKAIETLNELVVRYPNSRHLDEAQFRRAEYFFSRKRYLDAEEAYQVVLDIGKGSAFYELALYKQGWAFFKQELYEEALKDFIAMLDFKIAEGVDLEQIESKIEKKRIDDTYRVISLSFSYLGGAQAIVDFFNTHGPREYEASVYSHLGEYYLDKRRYSDAAQTYNYFVERNPLHKVAPYFQIRVIEIYLKGGFPKLVIEAKKNFSKTYGLNAAYWQFFDINKFPVVLAFLKSNLSDLANHYHALYQDKRLRKKKQENYNEAIYWYREYLKSFPEDAQAPVLNYQLAGLMLENQSFRDAALEYERTAYNYPRHEKSSEAGYAAVFAYRKYLNKAPASERALVKREIIRSSLKFVENFPKHKHAPVVLAAAAEDLYAIKDYPLAVKTAKQLLDNYPQADKKLVRDAWLIVAHGSFDLTNYVEAEKAYSKVLQLMPAKDKRRNKLIENLAASIYKQGEQARKLEKHAEAAKHFLRIAKLAPTASIRPVAEYDAAASLMVLKDWKTASSVLVSFRKNYPKHKLQPEVTKKLAFIYQKDGKLLQAAREYERIVRETKDDAIKREALLQAAELYEKKDKLIDALRVYRTYVNAYPRPLEFQLETRNKMAGLYKKTGDEKRYFATLNIIKDQDRNAGSERTDRTRYLGAHAALQIYQKKFDAYYAIKLRAPFKRHLEDKRYRMRQSINRINILLDYEIDDITAAATYRLADIYYHFSRALMESERPKGLSDLELEQYNLVLEEQAYPFEEKAIDTHEKNLELLELGVYNEWIQKSIDKLSTLLPARYNKPEQAADYVDQLVPLSQQPKQPEKAAQQPASAPPAVEGDKP